MIFQIRIHVLYNHKSFQNRLPVQNKFLAHKWDRHEFDTHRHRVSTLKIKGKLLMN